MKFEIVPHDNNVYGIASFRRKENQKKTTVFDTAFPLRPKASY